MSETRKVICDTCGKDITTSGNCEDWRLAVQNEPVPSRGGPVTLMSIHPILAANGHYCSWRCFVDSELVSRALTAREKEAARKLEVTRKLQAAEPVASRRADP